MKPLYVREKYWDGTKFRSRWALVATVHQQVREAAPPGPKVRAMRANAALAAAFKAARGIIEQA